MNRSAFDQELPSVLEDIIQANRELGETVLLRLKGAFREALVCTERRAMIVKYGFMTGEMFGSDIFQIPYDSIASIEVKFRPRSGYFEISVKGVHSTPKNYWSLTREENPTKAPSCVSLNSRAQADNFWAASVFIAERIDQKSFRRPPSDAEQVGEMASAIKRLWELKADGALSQASLPRSRQQAGLTMLRFLYQRPSEP